MSPRALRRLQLAAGIVLLISAAVLARRLGVP